MKTCLRILLLLCACTGLWAQDDQLDDFTIEDVPQEDVSTPYFGVGGGFVASFFFANFDELNKLVDTPGMLAGKKFDGSILMLGAQGFAAIPFIPNTRIGFTSAGGSKSVEGTALVGDAPNAVSYKRKFEYFVTYSALTFDYAFTPIKGLAVLPGIMGGWGSMKVRASQTPAVGERTIGGEFNFGTGTNNTYKEIVASHTTITPNLNIEYAVTPFSMIRVGAGYNVSLGTPSWEADNGITTVTGVSKDINMSGLSVQAGIFIGLFNH